MTYICLLASENGAMMAADTRLTMHKKFPKRTKIKDRRKKLYISSEGKVIWGIAGLTCLDYFDVAFSGQLILRNDKRSWEERVERFSKLMQKKTRQYLKKFKTPGVSNLLYASYMDPEHPVFGCLIIKNGEVISHKTESVPCFMQVGRNAALLSPSAPLKPQQHTPMKALERTARRRVCEAINYDRIRKEADESYQATVGGALQFMRISME